MKDEFVLTPFYSSFLSLCKQNGISPTEAAKRAEISSGAPTAWKRKGAIPKPEQRKKLCDLFGVEDEELMGYSNPEKEKPTGQEGGGEVDPLTKELLGIISKMNVEQKEAILNIAKMMT